jgi:hypothetical protein
MALCYRLIESKPKSRAMNKAIRRATLCKEKPGLTIKQFCGSNALKGQSKHPGVCKRCAVFMQVIAVTGHAKVNTIGSFCPITKGVVPTQDRVKSFKYFGAPTVQYPELIVGAFTL